jgi:hypothetical protein
MKTIIPADVYDTLELSAHAHGGIGLDQMYLKDRKTPCCLLGHIEEAAGKSDAGFDYSAQNEMMDAIRDAQGSSSISGENDTAVAQINQRLGRARTARVSFAQYVAARGWVRGAA